MAAICKRLLAFGEFELLVFGDDVILEQPVEEWPQCDALLSWHSDGFPLKKVRRTQTCSDRYLSCIYACIHQHVHPSLLALRSLHGAAVRFKSFLALLLLASCQLWCLFATNKEHPVAAT